METNDEARRQFICIARNILKFRTNSMCGGPGNRPGTEPLQKIGMEIFGLSSSQVRVCVNEARKDLEEINRLDRIRKAGRINFPTSSDELVKIATLQLESKLLVVDENTKAA